MANKIKEFHDEVVAFMRGYTNVTRLNLPTQRGTLTYNGASQSPSWNGYDPAQLLIGGTTSATNAGTNYTATFTPQNGYAWADGTQGTRDATWVINKAALNLSASISGTIGYGATGTITVTGNTGGGALSAASSNTGVATVTVSGSTIRVTGVSAGTATITVTAAATTNYAAGTATCNVTVSRASTTLTLSASSGTVELDGTTTFSVTSPSTGTITVSSSNTSVATATISGNIVTVRGVGAGNATITVSQAATTNYAAGTATYAATVSRASANLTLSSTSGTVTYGGTKTFTVTSPSDGALSVASSNANVATAAIDGNTVTVTSTGAGTATITVSQAASANYNAPTPKTYSLTVNKASVTLSLSETSGTIYGIGNSISFEVITPSDGAITATSSNTAYVTTAVSGTTVTLTNVLEDSAMQDHSTTITVSQAAGTNYNATSSTSSRTYKVIARRGKLITDSWATISTRSRNGTAASYYNVGDFKEITLNGNIGETMTFDNEKFLVYILHINYPMNGTAENNIIWGGFAHESAVRRVALNNTHEAAAVITPGMNHTYQIDDETANGYRGTNYGGWKGCDLRYDILGATSTAPSEYNQLKSPANVGYNATSTTLTNPKADTLLAALPSDFRSVLRLWSRWIDAKGNGLNTEEAIEETIDAVTLLTEFELFGRRVYANEYEQNYQTQMAYYAAGNSPDFFMEYPRDGAVNRQWLASPCSTDNYQFCYIYNTSGPSRYSASSSCGLAPAFKT